MLSILTGQECIHTHLMSFNCAPSASYPLTTHMLTGKHTPGVIKGSGSKYNWCCFCSEKPRGCLHFKAAAGLQGHHGKPTQKQSGWKLLHVQKTWKKPSSSPDILLTAGIDQSCRVGAGAAFLAWAAGCYQDFNRSLTWQKCAASQKT